MRIRLFFVGLGVLVCVCILTAKQSVSAQDRTKGTQPNAPAAAQSPTVAKSTCLSCHGPFDKLIEGTGNYIAPSGEKISPHRYVPHDSKKDEDVPECTNCHAAHSLDPLPTPGSIDKSKLDVKWCYDSCHHEKNFTSCKECHA